MLRRSQAELLDPVDDAEEGGEMPEGWSTGDILRDGSVRPSDAIGTPEDSDSARQESTSNLSATSSSMNPWGEPSPGPSRIFGQTPTSKKKIPGNEYSGMPEEGNVWDDSPSEGEEAPSESPVSDCIPLSLSLILIASRHISITPKGEGRYQEVEMHQRFRSLDYQSSMHVDSR